MFEERVRAGERLNRVHLAFLDGARVPIPFELWDDYVARKQELKLD